MKSKTIILSMENEKGRGILTLFQDEDLLQCRIRLYNMPKLTRFCKLGIYHNKEVYSANLLEKNGVYTSSMVGNFEIDKDFYAAIINTEDENKVILSGGTYAGFFFNEQSNFENELSKNNFTPAKIDENLNFEPNPSQNIFENIEKENPVTNLYTYSHTQNNESCCGENEKCKNCKYKEFFYSQNQQFKTEEDISEVQKNNLSLNNTYEIINENKETIPPTQETPKEINKTINLKQNQ